MKNENIKTKQKELEEALLFEIQNKPFRAHDLFFTEQEISERWGVSRITTRGALSHLTENGVVYKKQGKGTFVSPPNRQGIILLITAMESLKRESSHFHEFLTAAIEAAAEQNPPLSIHLIDIKELVNMSDDIKLHYKNLSGILLFRYMDILEPCKKKIFHRNIPILFCGSNTYEDELQKISTLFYQEEKIIDTALTHLNQMGYKNFYWVGTNTIETHKKREFLFHNYLKEHSDLIYNNSILLENSFYVQNVDYLSEIIKTACAKSKNTVPVFVCSDDRYAAIVLRCAKNIGLNIPHDLAVCGINNYPYASDEILDITTVDLGIYDAALVTLEKFFSKGELCMNTPIKDVTDISLVVRESTDKNSHFNKIQQMQLPASLVN